VFAVGSGGDGGELLEGGKKIGHLAGSFHTV
jgi:hypothetical protein